MKQLTQLQHALKAGVLTLLGRSRYQPTYRESSYRRPVFLRLTALTRFVLVLLSVVMLAGMGVLANQSFAARSNVDLLSDQLTAQPLPTLPVTPVLVISDSDVSTSTPAPESATTNVGEPAPTATPDLSRAPWANQLYKRPDGSLQAPQKILSQVTQDLAAYFLVQRDLPIDDWFAKRDNILTTYFTSTALQEMQGLEQSRDLYAMNRAGRFSIEVGQFTADGMAARAGIITRDWVSDVYDMQSKQLIARGKIKKDTLTIFTIAYNASLGHWQFARTEEVTELTP